MSSAARVICTNAAKLLGRRALPSRAFQQFNTKNCLHQTSSPYNSARSLWSVSAIQNRTWFTSTANSTSSCTCRGLHTEGDKELGEFLKDEIELEMKSQKNKGALPDINGFQVSKTDGCDIVLTKTTGNETVTVKWNVNHSVDEEVNHDSPDVEEGSAELEMVSKPEFVVEFNKGSSKTLAIQLVIPHNADISPIPQAGEEDASTYEDLIEDRIEISEVSLLDAGSEWDDRTFALVGTVMDGDLYDMILRMLEERGVDDQFVEQLITFSTAYEQNQYVQFLEGLKKFAENE